MDEFANNYAIDDAHEFDHEVGGNRLDTTNLYKTKTQHVVTFIRKRQPNPGGANVYALSTYGVPPFNPIGNAYFVRRMPYPCEPAYQAINQDTVDTQLGGLITGQAVGQPLYDPKTDTYGGLDLE